VTAVMEPVTTETAPTLPAPARTVWRSVASVAAVALLVWGALQTVSLLAHEERTFTRTFPSAGVATVEIELQSGSAEVVAADVDEITVTTRVSEGLRSTGHDQRIVGDRLVLTGTCPVFPSVFCDVRYEVQVPPEVGVVSFVDDGGLRVVGVSGPVRAESDNSGIEVVGVSGDLYLDSDNGSLSGARLEAATVEATTDNGSVHLEFVTAPELVAATSDNGSITVLLPEVDGGYRVEMDTDNGSTDLGVASDPSARRLVVANTDNGDVSVRATTGVDR